MCKLCVVAARYHRAHQGNQPVFNLSVSITLNLSPQSTSIEPFTFSQSGDQTNESPKT